MFTITGLDPALFDHYFAMSDAELAAAGARRVVADGPGFPCRVSLVDAAAGEEVVLCHHAHHVVDTAYRGSGPVYVRRAARAAAVYADAVPPALRSRLLSVRAYDAGGELRAAEVTPGAELESHIARMFADGETAYLHVHNAKPGCFAARVDRRD